MSQINDAKMAPMTVQTTEEAQNLQAPTAGVKSSVGKLGDHIVQMGKNPPIRLDQIKAFKIPGAGFRSATKVVNAKTGARLNAGKMLSTLAAGKSLDAPNLLSACKTMQTHLDRLDKLGQIRGNMDMAVLAAFAPEVESLNNTELFYAYQNLLSPEMSLLKKGLQAEIRLNPQNEDAMAALANMFSLEALVIKEISNRVIVAQGLAPAEDVPALSQQYGAGLANMGTGARHSRSDDITGVSLHVLTNVATEGAQRRDSVESMAHDITSRRNLDPIDAHQFGDVLRSSNLSINVESDFFSGIAGSKPLLQASHAWQSLFHAIEKAPDETARQAAIDYKGAAYINKRDNVERSLFPELPPGSATVASDRPTYAVLNTMRFDTGGASSYGTVTLHLKPEVARRATYTVNDTFLAIKLSYSEEKKQAALQLLPGWPNISAEHKSQLLTEGSVLRTNLDKTFAIMQKCGTFDGNALAERLTVAGLTQDEGPAMASLFIKVFLDAAATRKGVVTFDNLEALLPELSGVDCVNLARAAIDREKGGPGRVLTECNYIEAQLHGPIVLSRDVAEIVIAEDYGMPDTPVGQAWIRAIVAVLGGKQPEPADMAQIPDDKKTELAAIRAELGDATISVRFGQQLKDMTLKEKERIAEAKFYTAHMDQASIDEKMANLQSDEQIRTFCLNGLSEEKGWSALLRAYGDKPLFSSEQLPALRKAFTEAVEKYRRAPESGQGNETKLISNCMYRAMREMIGPERYDCLVEIPNLTTNRTQRDMLRDFVLNQTLLPLDVNTFRAMASSAIKGGALLKSMAAADTETNAYSDTAMMQQLGSLATSFRAQLDALPPSASRVSQEQLIQCMGKMALIMGEIRVEQEPLLRERLDSPAQREFASLILRLGNAETGFPKETGFKDACIISAFLGQLNTAYTTVMPPAFAHDLSLASTTSRALLQAALPKMADTLNTAFPAFQAFPVAAHPEKLLTTPAAQRQFLLNMLPTYHEHEKPGGFDHGTSAHGRGHISRAFIFSAAMANIMEGMGHTLDRTALLCGIAGHDAGRVQNGADTVEQETESVRLTLESMRNTCGDDAFGAEYETEFTHSIVGHAGNTVESMILTSADSLDIGRVKDFDFKYLPFLRGGAQESSKVIVPEHESLRIQLQEEANLLARMTDPITQTRELSFKLLEAGLMDDYRNIQTSTVDTVIGMVEMGNEEILTFVESKIRNHPTMFPLLTQFYLNTFNA